MNRKVTIQELTGPKKNKYGVRNDELGRSQRTYKGVLYDSKAEMVYAQELDILKASGHIREYHRQVVLPLMVNGTKVGKYIADFEVFDGHTVGRLIDCKGFQTPVSKLKIRLVKAIYGRTVEIVTR